MTKPFSVMLAKTVGELDRLRFPMLASPKLDGVRAYVHQGRVLTRNNKLVPNEFVQRLFGHLEYCDGELIAGPPTAKDAFTRTVSAVKRAEGEPAVTFHVFDCVAFGLSAPFTTRLADAGRIITKKKLNPANVVQVPHHLVHNPDDVLAAETKWLSEGYEGVMLRDPNGCYESKRSSLLLKLKRFDDAEARIIGFEELMHNGNEPAVNELGVKARSHRKAGMHGRHTLGALRVVGINGPYRDVVFSIGTGFTQEARRQIWLEREQWFGQAVKYKYFRIGAKDAPRFPVYLGPRPEGL